MSLPFVTCICMTYGRTTCLEEAIQFFLTQDYQGPKELIVVNDLGEQELVFVHPDVRIFNLRTRFPTLGAKRDFAVGHSRGEVIVTWDDDDGYLPSHLAECVRLLQGHDYARPDKCFVWVGADTIERISGSFLAQIVFTKDLYARAGGYGARSYGEDSSLNDRMLAVPGVRTNFAKIADSEITFLFRWANGEYHLSGYGPERPGQRRGYDRVALEVQGQVRSGQVRSGSIRLVPRFRSDYSLMVHSFLRSTWSSPPTRLLKSAAEVVCTQLFDEDLPPQWSVSMWVAKRPPAKAAPISLFDSREYSIRLSQFGSLSRFGVTRYGHRDWTFDFAPRDHRLTHVALVARPREVALFVDGRLVGALPEAIRFPKSVADAQSLVEYRVFSGALTEDEIGALARERPTGSNVGVRLRFTTNWIDDAAFARYLSKMTKGGGVWNRLEIVDTNEDYTVVVNHPRDEKRLDPRTTIHLHMEPECTRRTWGRWHRPDASKVEIAFDDRNALEWHLSLDHARLSHTRPQKSKLLSAVVSDLAYLDGHRLRLHFIRDHLDQLPYFDHYGRGSHPNRSFRGHLARKEDGLFPYAYTFAAENCYEPGYFTEKFADAILSECLVFYWGCPDIERWIDPGCFIRLDLRDPVGALAVVKESIERGEWEKRIEVIRREKSKILDELQIFPTIERLLNQRAGCPVRPGKAGEEGGGER